MYAKPVVATAVPAVAAITLPNTGSNLLVSAAASVAVGLAVWGVLSARAGK